MLSLKHSANYPIEPTSISQDLFDLIEDGADWPDYVCKAMAAFLSKD